MHERLGARNIISRDFLWTVGKKHEECQKAKPDFRAFYWREQNSEIWEEVKPTVRTSLGQHWHSRLPRLGSPKRGWSPLLTRSFPLEDLCPLHLGPMMEFRQQYSLTLEPFYEARRRAVYNVQAVGKLFPSALTTS